MNVRLLLSTQRSGSHFLKSYIESHFSGVVCSGEILREPGALARQYPALPNQPEFPHFWPWYEARSAEGKISVAPDKRLEASEIVENRQKVIRLVRTTEHGWMTDTPFLAAA
jgi:hypothetical protein